jgi:hypothetical protein
MREVLGPEMITVHQCHHPEIRVEGATATGWWYLADRVIMPAQRLVLEGAAFYDDRYVLSPDGWRISHTGYRRTYETTMSMDDLQSYRLKVGNAYQ